MEAICRRAATIGFTNDSLGLHPGVETERLRCLDLINRGQVADGIAVPHAILDAPFPPEQKLRYFIEDVGIVRTRTTTHDLTSQLCNSFGGRRVWQSHPECRSGGPTEMKTVRVNGGSWQALVDIEVVSHSFCESDKLPTV
jgi:hypothetical protein